MNLGELEQLADETADVTVPESTNEQSGANSTTASTIQAAESSLVQSALKEAAPPSNPTNREILSEMQTTSKVQQNLFYGAGEGEEDEKKEDEEAGEGKKKQRKKRNKRKKKQVDNDISDFHSQSELDQNQSIVDANDPVIKELVAEVSKEEDEGKTLQSSAHQSNFKFSTYYDDEFNALRDVLGESFYEDEDSSEDEGMPDYKIGGYHPIHVGEILMDRYVIIQKLGWGHFSTVWLTKDLKFNSYVALKVQKSAQHYVEAAYDEVDILDQVAQNWRTDNWRESILDYYKNDKYLMTRLNKYGVTAESSHCAQLLNSFIHHGPNGKHFIMVFEILGVNFLEIIKRYDYKGVPLPLVRRLARQCLIGLDYMHRMC